MLKRDLYNKITTFDKKNCIYKMFCKDTSVCDFYIGRAVNMRKRAREHYNMSFTDYNKTNRLYKFIKEKGGIENFDIDILEYDIHSNELNNIESKYIINMKPTLNTKKK